MVGSPSPHETARYRIRVSGRLEAIWSERSRGMTLVVHDQDPAGVWSELRGPLADQAALMAVLEQLALRGIVLLDCGREPGPGWVGPATASDEAPHRERDR